MAARNLQLAGALGNVVEQLVQGSEPYQVGPADERGIVGRTFGIQAAEQIEPIPSEVLHGLIDMFCYVA